jgi:citrate lyase beta subunit
VLIETALGMANVEAIAQSSRKRLEALQLRRRRLRRLDAAAPPSIGGANKD